MFNRVGSAIASGWNAVDAPVRRYMNDRAQDVSDARRNAYMKEYQGRYQSSAKDTLDQMAEVLGKGTDREELERLMGAGGKDAEMVLASVARARAESELGVRMRRALAGTTAMDRTQQVLAYGGLAGGLTAAGQGLMALMDYMQQGAVNQAERDQGLA
jgi:hypothetical protein